MYNRMKVVVLFGLALLVAGCSSMPGMYNTEIYQGNYVESERLENIKPGMTQAQVQYILGTPLINDNFDENVWYYIFSHYRSNGEQIMHQNIQVHFDKNKKVSHVEVKG